jgi:hypothetical protein
VHLEIIFLATAALSALSLSSVIGYASLTIKFMQKTKGIG